MAILRCAVTNKLIAPWGGGHFELCRLSSHSLAGLAACREEQPGAEQGLERLEGNAAAELGGLVHRKRAALVHVLVSELPEILHGPGVLTLIQV